MPLQGARQLWIPNNRGVLHKAVELVFNDAPWLEAQGLNHIHPKLSYDVGRSFPAVACGAVNYNQPRWLVGSLRELRVLTIHMWDVVNAAAEACLRLIGQLSVPWVCFARYCKSH